MATVLWDAGVAAAYDQTSAEMFAPEVLDATVDFLVGLAGDGPALEFAIGTGRVALPLHARGIEVSGIELSPHMAEQLRAKPSADQIAVTIGDMATTRVEGSFSLVYLVFNTIMNVTTQAEQVNVFANAAAHLRPGGHFVVEVVVPQPQLFRPDELGHIFTLRPDNVGIDTLDDPVGQISSSHHWMDVGGRLVTHSAPYRYVWPSELDLMGQLAGLHLRERWANWGRMPFTATSGSQIAVFTKPAA